MKKNKNTTANAVSHKTSKNAPTSGPTIQTLNDAYQGIVKAQDACTAAYKQNAANDVVHQLKKQLRDDMHAFIAVRDQLQGVKFDYLTGKYFSSNRDEDGCETYHLAVTRSHKFIVEVRAVTPEEAIKKMESECLYDLAPSAVMSMPTTVKVENVSTPA